MGILVQTKSTTHLLKQERFFLMISKNETVLNIDDLFSPSIDC